MIVLAVIVVIIVIVAVTVVEEKKKAYPDYSQLNYTLVDQFSGTSFFNNFDYFTGYDPTAGFVHYLTLEQNLTVATSSTAILKVDTSGRYSVRVTSKNTYNNGLFIFDITHGEVDVMEAVNQANTGNQMTLHTTDECSMSVKRKEAGKILTDNCYNGTNSNSGCSVQGANSTFGALFNAAEGGIMALETRTAGIRMWQFGRSNIPIDITNKTPDLSTWREALADFPSTNCDIAAHFGNLSVIVDVDICGSWAGNPTVYSTQDSCPWLCTDYAASQPSAFIDAYWEFGPAGFNVYQAT